MNVVTTDLPGVLIIEPKVFGDERGFFYESFNARAFKEATGLETSFVQDDHSRSQKGVLRGLHYQLENTQGKLVRVTTGEVLDVAVDIRRSSPYFGKWVAVRLSAENHRQMWVPEGFAHGFVVLSEFAEFLYKPPTTTPRPPSAAFAGTTRTWPLIGNWTKRHNCPAKIKPLRSSRMLKSFPETPSESSPRKHPDPRRADYASKPRHNAPVPTGARCS